MKKIKKIFIRCLKKREYSLTKSIFYSYFSKKIKCDSNSFVLIQRHCKLLLGKKAVITIKSGELIIEASFVDLKTFSLIKLEDSSCWNIFGIVKLCGCCIHLCDNAIFECGDLRIYAFSKITIEHQIHFGNNVLIGRFCFITDTNSHDIYSCEKDISRQKDVYFGNNIWICANCNILRGAKIGNNIVIGAGTTLSSCIDDNKLIYSNYTIKEKNINYWNS